MTCLTTGFVFSQFLLPPFIELGPEARASRDLYKSTIDKLYWSIYVATYVSNAALCCKDHKVRNYLWVCLRLVIRGVGSHHKHVRGREKEFELEVVNYVL